MKELNVIVLGKWLFASKKGQLCLIWVIKKGSWKSSTPLIGSCFENFHLQKSFHFFPIGHFLTKHPIPG